LIGYLVTLSLVTLRIAIRSAFSSLDCLTLTVMTFILHGAIASIFAKRIGSLGLGNANICDLVAKPSIALIPDLLRAISRLLGRAFAGHAAVVQGAEAVVITLGSLSDRGPQRIVYRAIAGHAFILRAEDSLCVAYPLYETKTLQHLVFTFIGIRAHTDAAIRSAGIGVTAIHGRTFT